MRKQFFTWSLLYFLTAALAVFLFLFEKGVEPVFGPGDIPNILLILIHMGAGVYFASRLRVAPDVLPAGRMAERLAYRMGQQDRQPESEDFMLLPDTLFALSLVIFLFEYIFALAANMDYVQRFIETEGRLLLALDTRTERMFVFFRYGIYLLIYPVVAGVPMLLASSNRRLRGLRTIKPMVLLLSSVFLFSFSFPSNISADGLGFLGWFSLVPLLVLLKDAPGFRRWMFYGVFWTLLTVMIRNYWLGTFSLVSLQVAVLILGFYGGAFFTVIWFAEKLMRAADHRLSQRPAIQLILYVLLFSSLWTLYDWIFTIGFTAYPWSIMPHTQWRNTPLMQVLPVTGMWSISQLLYISNILIAGWFVTLGRHRLLSRRMIMGFIILVALIHAGGAGILLQQGPNSLELVASIEIGDDGEIHAPSRSYQLPGEDVHRIALVQQNSDPRKHDYEAVLDTLVELTDGILERSSETDLVVWSETAFVPNIARWGAPDQNPGRRLVRVVREMLDYQAGLGTWLLTGNDDYEVNFDEEGRELSRDNYNAAVFFSPDGQRRDTYRKIKLVPFTEHFPYREQFPRVYQLLLDFDVNFWEPGETRTVFRHENFTFSTPICFEDAFPDEVRRFVAEGADIIINISNDYWSLTEVAAKQHFAASVFRAPENRRVFLRSTASGMTTAVDPWGRILFELPSYTASAASVDVVLEDDLPKTVYTRFGDWFVLMLSFITIGIVAGLGIPMILRRRRKGEE
jgi:apolipoprotein N-acyltransferase